MTEAQAIQKVTDLALEEVGYLEKASNSQLDSKTANAGYNNFTKYWRDAFPSYQGQYWCAIFVTWLLMQCFGVDAATKLLKHFPFVYCPTLAAKFTVQSTPKVGCIVLFHNGTRFSHTGFVIGVSGNTFTTVEGNTSSVAGVEPNGGGVFKKTHNVTSSTKFVYLDWSIVADIDTAQTKEEIIAWGFAIDNISHEEAVKLVPQLQKRYVSIYASDYIRGSQNSDGSWKIVIWSNLDIAKAAAMRNEIYEKNKSFLQNSQVYGEGVEGQQAVVVNGLTKEQAVKLVPQLQKKYAGVVLARDVYGYQNSYGTWDVRMYGSGVYEQADAGKIRNEVYEENKDILDDKQVNGFTFKY
ncbi:MAG: CHAP domain-containing protein [Lachnospiraceae bacterium]